MRHYAKCKWPCTLLDGTVQGATLLSQPAGWPSHALWAYAQRSPALLHRDIAPLVCKLLELSRHGISRYAREHRRSSPAQMQRVAPSPARLREGRARTRLYTRGTAVPHETGTFSHKSLEPILLRQGQWHPSPDVQLNLPPEGHPEATMQGCTGTNMASPSQPGQQGPIRRGLHARTPQAPARLLTPQSLRAPAIIPH